MPTRIVTILCLIQVFALAACYLMAAAWLRAAEKSTHHSDWLQHTHWFSQMSFVRSFIWLLLLIPIANAVVCAKCTRTHRDIALLGQDGFWLAVVVTVVVAIYAMATILTAFQGPPPRHGQFLNL